MTHSKNHSILAVTHVKRTAAVVSVLNKALVSVFTTVISIVAAMGAALVAVNTLSS